MKAIDATDKLAEAVRHHEAGRLQRAEALYRDLLAADPRNVDALHLLGVLCGQTRREDEAIGLINAAIALRPDLPAQHNNLGNILRQKGRFSQAIAAFRAAVGIEAGYARAWNNLGNALKDDGQIDAAIDAYYKALQLGPDVAEVHSNLGIALRERGHIEEAIAAHRQALALAPESFEALNNLGVALRDAGRFSEALTAHEKAATLRPNSVSALANLGAAQRRRGNVEGAIRTLRRALALDENHAEAHNNLGSALIDQSDFAAAEVSLRRTIALKPTYADGHANLAIALAYQGRVADAMTHGRLAVGHMPGQPLAHWNLSMLLLLVGDFDLGWAEHEWRWKCASMLKERQFNQPRWDGEPLAGRTILLFAEQGFGDTLQFVRYAPLVARRGGRVIVECQRELVRLFQGMCGVARFVAVGEALPEFDLQCPLMSVPFALRRERLVNGGAILSEVPYLFSPERDTLKSKTGRQLDVGLVWAGDPKHQNDGARSISLAQLSPLAGLPGITFHSLQKGPASSQAIDPPAGMNLVDHSANLADFAATASVISALDLVITVDTAVAHLAAGMGKKTWVLLPFMPDWRWMLQRSDCPWYPTIRLFRQSTTGEWASVVRAVRGALKDLIAESL